ncbi:MAG: hypothetical protein ACLPXB_15785 [Thiobacillaceae bacterium]
MNTQSIPTDTSKPFQEYPALTATMKDETGNFYTLRAWSPRPDDPAREAGDLRASLSINGPGEARERHSVDLKAREQDGYKYFSGKIERGDAPAVLVRIVGVDGKDGRFASLRLSEFGKDAQGKSDLYPIKGQGGILRMNEPMAALDKIKDTYEVAAFEKQLDVKVDALAPKLKDHSIEATRLGPVAQEMGMSR